MIRAPENRTLPKLHQLLKAERQRAGAGAGVDLDAQALEVGGGFSRHPPPVYDSKAVRQLAPEEHVLRHCQVRGDAEFLMNHADTGLQGVMRGAESRRRAVDQHRALKVDLRACDDLHERALAGSIFSDKPVDLAPVQGKVDALKGENAAKRFGDPAQRENGRVFVRRERAGQEDARFR